MPLNQQFFDRLNATTDIHAKFLRAIAAGSKRLHRDFMTRQSFPGGNLIAHEVDPENPSVSQLTLNSEVPIKLRQMGCQMILKWSVQPKPENCGAAMTFLADDKFTGNGRHMMELSGTLTQDGGTLWQMKYEGPGNGLLAAMVTEYAPKGNASLKESDALLLVRSLSKDFAEQFI